MRTEDHGIKTDQFVVRIDRLWVEDVQAGSGYRPVPQSCGEGHLVHECTAADIDEVCRVLHQSEPTTVDHATALVVE